MMGAGLPSGGHNALLFFLISFFITVAQGLKHFVINANAFFDARWKMPRNQRGKFEIKANTGR